MMVTVNGQTITQTFYDKNGVQMSATGSYASTETFQAAGPSIPLSTLGNLVVY